MQASLKVIAFAACTVLATFGSVAANAEKTDGSDFHPLQMNSPASAEIDAGAVAAAHPAPGEPIGQTTAAAMLKTSMSSDDAYKSAIAAAHPSPGEPIGQATALPLVRSAQ
jgi:hypothetical protein